MTSYLSLRLEMCGSKKQTEAKRRESGRSSKKASEEIDGSKLRLPNPSDNDSKLPLTKRITYFYKKGKEKILWTYTS